MTKEKLEELKRQRDWLANVYEAQGDIKRAAKVRSCMEPTVYLQSSRDDKIQVNWHRTWGCHDRGCPLCTWRDSCKVKYDIYKRLEQVAKMEGKSVDDYKHRFMTFTVSRNVPKEELKPTLRQISQAWTTIKTNHKHRFSRAVKGDLRMIDSTYNEQTGEFNAHVHILTTHVKSYEHNPNYTITQDTWLQWWQDAMHDPTITQAKNKPYDIPANAASYGVLHDLPLTADNDTIEAFVDAFRGTIRVSKGGIYSPRWKPKHAK